MQCSSQVFEYRAFPTAAANSQSQKLTLLPPIPQTLFLLPSRSAPESVSVYGSPILLVMGDVLTILYPDIRRERHPPVPHACELPSHQRSRRLPRPSLRRPRTHFLPRVTRRHSPNPYPRRWTFPANLPIAGPNALPVPPVRMPPYPRSGFSPEPVS